METKKLGPAIRKGTSLSALLIVFLSGVISGDNMELTQERAKELFEYREDGILIWKKGQRLGKEANCIDKAQGYRRVRIDNKLYKNSRVVFLYHNGYLPKIVDHKNRNRLDDRIENLRESNDFKNSLNRGLSARNVSGKSGVQWCSTRRLWRSRIALSGVDKHLGYFDNKLDAIEERKKAEIKYHGEHWPS